MPNPRDTGERSPSGTARGGKCAKCGNVAFPPRARLPALRQPRVRARPAWPRPARSSPTRSSASPPGRFERPGAVRRRHRRARRRRPADGPGRRLRLRRPQDRDAGPARVPQHLRGGRGRRHLLRLQVRSGIGARRPPDGSRSIRRGQHVPNRIQGRHPDPEFRRQRRGHDPGRGRIPGAAGQGPGRRAGRSPGSSTSRAASSSSASAWRGSSTAAPPSSSSAPSPPTACTTTRRPRPGWSPASASSTAARCWSWPTTPRSRAAPTSR